MTNKKFEQILRHALVPEIDDSEIQIGEKKVRSFEMKPILKITAAAACAAIVFGIGGNMYLRDRSLNGPNISNTESNVDSIISGTEKLFVLKVGAEEITPNKAVPLSFESVNSASLGGSEQDGNVKYCISTGIKCEGEGIESVSYSINKGAFAIAEAHENGSTLIRSGTLYEGDTNFPGHWSENLNNYPPETIDIKYYTEYTLDYDSVQSDRLCINICGEVFDKDIFSKVFDYTNTPEDKAEANTELMKGVEITCTVHYTDGTTDSQALTVESQVMTIEELGYPVAPDDDLKRETATFVYKLK